MESKKFFSRADKNCHYGIVKKSGYWLTDFLDTDGGVPELTEDFEGLYPPEPSPCPSAYPSSFTNMSSFT